MCASRGTRFGLGTSRLALRLKSLGLGCKGRVTCAASVFVFYRCLSVFVTKHQSYKKRANLPMPVCPICSGSVPAFSRRSFYEARKKSKVLKQTTIPTKGLQDIEINRVPRSPTKTPTVDPVEEGCSLGRRTRHIGQRSHTKYQGMGFRGLRESHRSTKALATSSIEATPSSSLGYTATARTVEGVNMPWFRRGAAHRRLGKSRASIGRDNSR